jgi:hypothetical protein
MVVTTPRAAFIGLLAHGLIVNGAAAQDQTSCSEAHRRLLEKLEQQSSDMISSERLAAQRRRAKRIYDACITGDVHDPKALFDRLDVRRY